MLWMLFSAGQEAYCVVCDRPGYIADQLFCTSCGQHYHGNCLDPPVEVNAIVRAGWQCPECKICQTCRWVAFESVLLAPIHGMKLIFGHLMLVTGVFFFRHCCWTDLSTTRLHLPLLSSPIQSLHHPTILLFPLLSTLRTSTFFSSGSIHAMFPVVRIHLEIA